MNLGTCWQPDVWQDGSWVEESWCPEVFVPCSSAPIGSTWANGSWEDTSWCLGTWADISVPPVVPVPEVLQVEQRRWPGPSIVIYDELEQLEKIKRKLREEEEIIIL